MVVPCHKKSWFFACFTEIECTELQADVQFENRTFWNVHFLHEEAFPSLGQVLHIHTMKGVAVRFLVHRSGQQQG